MDHLGVVLALVMALRVAQPGRELDLTLLRRRHMALLLVVAAACAVLATNCIARAGGVAAEDLAAKAQTGALSRHWLCRRVETMVALETAQELAILAAGVTAIPCGHRKAKQHNRYRVQSTNALTLNLAKI